MRINRNATILIVDDEPDNLQAIEDVFINANVPYKIIKSPSGMTALQIAQKKLPDLVIADWDMPEMDGIELISQLKSNKETKDIPVIMCTGVMTTSENLEMALNAGAADYIRKPVDPIELIARTNSMLKLGSTFKEINEKNRELSENNEKLQIVLDELKRLKGIIPICSYCKKIRDDEGVWNQLEDYIRSHSEAHFSHGACPVCYKKQMKEVDLSKTKKITEPNGHKESL